MSNEQSAQSGAGPDRHSGGRPWWRHVLIGMVLFISWPLLLPIILLYLLIIGALYLAIWCWWLPRGRDVLFVYSESPIWQPHIEREILPIIRHRAVVLDWSRRRRWRGGLATMAFRHFGGYRAFNPLAVVFRPFRRARVFRFWQPFRDAKHGNPMPLERMQRDLFTLLGVAKENQSAP